MTVFYCADCGRALTGDLVELPEAPTSYDDENRDEDNIAPSTIRRGRYAIEREPWSAPLVPAEDQDRFQAVQPRSGGFVSSGVWMRSAGPRGSVLLNPEDLIGTERTRVEIEGRIGSHGCGPSGMMGPNRGCACGAAVATLSADCSTPYEVHLDPRRVTTEPRGQRRPDQRIYRPLIARAITSRWISLVPSKMV